jgi:C4-type Zn-finger protein
MDCPNCSGNIKIQANLNKEVPIEQGVIKFPENNEIKCPSCSTTINLQKIRGQLESQTKKKIV